MTRDLRRLKMHVTGNDDAIPWLHETGRRSVDLHLAGLALDNVGCETRAVGDIVDIHLLEFEQSRRQAKFASERNRAFVIKIGRRDRGTVEFGL